MLAIQGHTTAIPDDHRLVEIVIPGNGSDGATIGSFFASKKYAEQVVTWEIVDNDDDIDLGKRVNLTGPKITFSRNAGIPPTVGKESVSTTYVRSTKAGTVAAILVVYIMNEEVLSS